MFYEIVKITNDMFMTKFLPIKLSELIGFFFFFFLENIPPQTKKLYKNVWKKTKKSNISFFPRQKTRLYSLDENT